MTRWIKQNGELVPLGGGGGKGIPAGGASGDVLAKDSINDYDTAWITPSSLSSWVVSGNDIYRLDGRVGIGADTPGTKLHVRHNDNWGGITIDKDSATRMDSEIKFRQQGAGRFNIGTDYNGNNTRDLYIWDGVDSQARLYIDSGGRIGVNNVNPGTNSSNTIFDVLGGHIRVRSSSYHGFALADSSESKWLWYLDQPSSDIRLWNYQKDEDVIAVDHSTSEVEFSGTVVAGGLVSNGAPVVESGSDSNGNWVKWSDGTMIIHKVETVTDQSIDNAYGSLYQGVRAYTFPQQFSETPTPLTTVFKWGTSASWGTVSAISTTSISIRGIDVNQRASGTETIIGYAAIGKWK